MNYPDMSGDEQRDGLYGVYPAIVADIEDPEDMARVKVRFPWRDADDQSPWARIVTPMAGKNMGTYFLPEKGDEVLVAFEDGDIHEPYVIGSLWTGKQSPPQKNKKKNPIRQIKSRAGHTITLDDTKDKGNVEIKTGKGQTILIDDKNDKIKIEDSKGNTVEMGSSGISLNSDKDISLSGKNIKLSAKQKASISANQLALSAKSQGKIASKGQLNLQSKGMANLKAKGMLNVKSSGLVKVKGSLVMIN